MAVELSAESASSQSPEIPASASKVNMDTQNSTVIPPQDPIQPPPPAQGDIPQMLASGLVKPAEENNSSVGNGESAALEGLQSLKRGPPSPGKSSDIAPVVENGHGDAGAMGMEVKKTADDSTTSMYDHQAKRIKTVENSTESSEGNMESTETANAEASASQQQIIEVVKTDGAGEPMSDVQPSVGSVSDAPIAHSGVSVTQQLNELQGKLSPTMSKSSLPVEPEVVKVESNSALLQLQMKWCTNSIRSLKRHTDAVAFLKPVDPVALGIPDYFNVIKHPMDLSTVEMRMKSYRSHTEFCADVELMLNNCFLYNPPSHPVHQMGKRLETYFNGLKAKIPKLGDELRVSTKTERKTPVSISPSSSRPHRDVGPPREYVSEEPRKKKSRRGADEVKWCQNVHRELLKKQYEAFMFAFYLPVDPIALNIPNYFDVIQHPMDLSTMKKKLDSGEYFSAAQYEADFRLMVNNCFTFNRPGDAVYEMGQRAEDVFNRKWREKPDFTARSSHSNSVTNLNAFSAFGMPMEPPKKTRKYVQDSDFDTSTDDEDVESIQIQMVEQQIALLQQQVEQLRQKRKKKLGKKKSASRRSSKGSNKDVSEPAYVPPPRPEPPAKSPKPPKPPKAPKQKSGRKPGRPRKSIEPPEIREITFEEKRELSEAIPALTTDKLARVVSIIHESMPHLKDNASDEIELDIDSLDLVTLNRLWWFVKGSSKPRRAKNDEDHAAAIQRMAQIQDAIDVMDGRIDQAQRLAHGDDSSSNSSSNSDGSESEDN